jgi:TPR repeat protein
LAKDEVQAVFWYRKAADQGDVDAENSIAWLYLTSADPALRDPTAALQYARKAVKAGNDNPNPNYLDTLAEAYYAKRQYREAVKSEQEAIRRAALQKESNRFMSEFQERLAKYQRAGEGEPPGGK